MSETELKKLEELKRLKMEKKKAKKKAAADALAQEPSATTMKADALPAIQMHRKGGFDMIPDFLK